MRHKKQFYLLLDNIRSLFNVGAIFRTADAAGIDKIILGGITCLRGQTKIKELNPKISKTALGAEKIIPWEHAQQTWRVIEKLKKQGFQIVALEQSKKSINYNKFKPKFPLVLIVGNEINGVSKNLLKRANKIIHLPMAGKKESLNVGVATGIALYQINKNRLGV